MHGGDEVKELLTEDDYLLLRKGNNARYGGGCVTRHYKKLLRGEGYRAGSPRDPEKVRGLRLKMGSTYVVKGNQMLLGVWVWNDTLFCGVVVVLSDGYFFF